MTHQPLKVDDTSNLSIWQSGIDLVREGAGESGAVWHGFRPFQIVSLLEMFPFYPNGFYVDGYFLTDLMDRVRRRMDKPGSGDERASEDEIAALRRLIDGGLARESERIGLQRTSERLENLKTAEDGVFTLSYLIYELRGLNLAIAKDLRERTFLYMPADQVTKAILEHVKAFMGQLATRLKE